MGFPTGQILNIIQNDEIPNTNPLLFSFFPFHPFSSFPPSSIDFFPVLFAIPRVAGWLAHWNEACLDESGKIWRPRQVNDHFLIEYSQIC